MEVKSGYAKNDTPMTLPRDRFPDYLIPTLGQRESLESGLLCNFGTLTEFVKRTPSISYSKLHRILKGRQRVSKKDWKLLNDAAAPWGV